MAGDPLESCSAYISFFLISSPVFVSMATFAVYSLDQPLTPEVIFPALAYFNLLRFPLTFMPVLIIGAAPASRGRRFTGASLPT